jgi:hypothetical protein
VPSARGYYAARSYEVRRLYVSNLRYASASATGDRLWDSVEERYFITEKKAVENLNEKLERAAVIVEGGSSGTGERCETEGDLTENMARRIRALKENT